MTRGRRVIGETVPYGLVWNEPAHWIRASCCEFWCKFTELECGGVTVDARQASGSVFTETHSVHAQWDDRILNKRCVRTRFTTRHHLTTVVQTRSRMYTFGIYFVCQIDDLLDKSQLDWHSLSYREASADSRTTESFRASISQRFCLAASDG